MVSWENSDHLKWGPWVPIHLGIIMGTPGPHFPAVLVWGPLCENGDPHLMDIKQIKWDS